MTGRGPDVGGWTADDQARAWGVVLDLGTATVGDHEARTTARPSPLPPASLAHARRPGG
ncbi:hypothetical protein ACFU5O_35955 [Streptomyces sp. NPDC057445]|uniref:hypothetical protein n=1 Tax=Streptomyces sp. NPDC057445 TaxID=3346136 RepID=UPI0036C2DBA9